MRLLVALLLALRAFFTPPPAASPALTLEAREREARLALRSLLATRRWWADPMALQRVLELTGGVLPALAGAETVTASFFLFPKEKKTTNLWTAKGGEAAANHWKEVAQTEAREPTGAEHVNTGKGLEKATAGESDRWVLENLKLPAGATFKKCNAAAIHMYDKTAESKAAKGTVKVFEGIFKTELKIEREMTNTAAENKWETTALAKATAEGLTSANLVSEEITGEVTSVKAKKSEVFVFYFKVEVEYETGGTTPAKLELSAAASESGASGSLRALTQIPLVAAPSTSAATLALQAKTLIALVEAPSTSGASLALAAKTQVPLNAAPSTSAATLALGAATRIGLEAAPSTSSATLALTAATQLGLGAAPSESGGKLLIEIGGVRIPLNAGASESGATLRLRARTELPVQPAPSSSSSSLGLRAPATLGLQSASSTSSASLTLSVGAPAEASFAEGGTQAGLGARGGASGGTSATGGLTGGLHYAGASAAATAGAGGSIGGVIGTGGTP